MVLHRGGFPDGS